MSELGVEEKMDLVRRSIEGWNENDWETLRAIWDPEGEIVAPEGWPEAGTFQGWDQLLDQWRRVKDSWNEEHAEAHSLTPVGDRVLAEGVWSMTGEASGAPVEVEMGMLYEFRGGRISRIRYFLDRKAARAAAEEGAGE
jgi:ketosteroid isomerase-like protein